MIRYTVVWTQSAQNQLAELWMSAPDRNSVTAAADRVDVELAVDAASKGVQVSEGLRGLTSAPLRVLFTVNDGDRIVEVVRVRRD